MYCYVWTFLVKPEFLADFQLAYGQEGEWVRLFRNDPAYRYTHLLGDRENPARFMTVDYWDSRAACLSFRQRHREQFDALDERFSAFTVEETHVGDFDLVGA